MGREGKQRKKNEGAGAGKCCRGLSPHLPQADWCLALLGVTAPLADTPDFYVFITEQGELRCRRSLVGTLGHLCPLPAPHPPLSLGALGMAGEKKREGLDTGKTGPSRSQNTGVLSCYLGCLSHKGQTAPEGCEETYPPPIQYQ